MGIRDDEDKSREESYYNVSAEDHLEDYSGYMGGYDYTKSPGYDDYFGDEDRDAGGQGTDEEEPPQEEAPQRPRKKRRKKHYFLRFCIVIALIAGAAAFLLSSYFSIDSIKVTGADHFTSGQIVKMSGAKQGENIFVRGFIHRSGIKSSLKKSTYIKAVNVDMELPNKLVISVTERKPIAAILIGKRYTVIDKTGYVIDKLRKPHKYTVLQGLKVKSAQTGEIISVQHESVMDDTLTLLALMDKRDLYFKKIVMGDRIVKAYIYDTLELRGTPDNIIKHIKNGDIEKVLYDLYKKKVKKGTISVGADKYISYSPKIK
ncbi:MAG: FtsQ-type POTRA domain-containing protein [Eubacteriaceae bacterium]|jgi:cell division protein FtsQ|nr:FtsQ-type POTRA domain-containing protein [Eubacteriaceae bacterium]